MSYYVKRSSGKILGPFKSRIIEGMIRSKQVNADTEISTDKSTWMSVAEVEGFAKLLGVDFAGVAARSKHATDRATLPVDDGAAFGLNLPKAKSSNVDQDAKTPLPAVKDNKFRLDLPKLKSKDGPSDLPRPKSFAELPAVKKKGSNLPTLKSAADLPIIKPSNLPSRRGSDLPSTKGSDLPAQKGSDLPADKGGETQMLGGGRFVFDEPDPRSDSPTPLPTPKTRARTRKKIAALSPDDLPLLRGEENANNRTALAFEDRGQEMDDGIPLLDDDLLGGAGDDMLDFGGGGGDDMLDFGDGGGGGDDLLDFGGGGGGGGGDDLLDFGGGGGGDDLLDFGGGGSGEDDLLLANASDDLLGSGGNDLLDFGGGGSGEDDLLGGGGDDLLDFGGGGGGGDDLLMGNASDALLMGNASDDLLGGGTGGQSDDLLGLGGGDDALDFGGADDDDPLGLGLDGDKDPLGLGGGDADHDDDPLGLGLGASSHSDDLLGEPDSDFHPFDEDSTRDATAGGGPTLAAPGTSRSSNYLHRDEEEDDEAIDLEPESRSVLPPKPSDVETEPTPVKPSDGGRSPMLLVALLGVAVVGLVVAGFLGMGPLGFLGEDDAAAPAPTGPETVEAPPVDIHPDSVTPDNFSIYQRFIKEAQEKLSATQSPKVQGVLLGVIALEMVRFPDMAAQREPLARQLLAEVSKGSANEWPSALGQGAWFAYLGEPDTAQPFLLSLSKDPELAYFGDLLRGVAEMRKAEVAELDLEAQREQLKKAQPHFERAASNNKAGPAASYLLGQLLLELDQSGKAQKAFEAALTQAPEHAGSHLGIARILMDEGQSAEATPHIQKILDTHAEGSDGPPAFSGGELATAYYLSGRESLLRDDTDLAIGEFQKALGFDPNHVEAIAALGDTFYRWQRFEEGIEYFEKNYGTQGDRDVEVVLALTKSYIGQSQRLDPSTAKPIFAKANELLAAARKQHESDPRIPYWQGILFEEQAEMAQAEASLRIALEQDPRFLIAKIRLVRLLSLKETDEAEVEASELVRDLLGSDLDPREMSALGAYLIESQELCMEKARTAKKDIAAEMEACRRVAQEGKKLLEKTIGINKRWVPAHEALADYYVDRGLPEKAIFHLGEVKKYGALRPRDRYTMARSYFAQGDYKAAAETMDELLTLVEDDPEYQYFAGRAYFARESYPTALSYFKKARDIDQSFWPAAFFIGRTELEMGNAEDALAIFRTAHDSNRDNGEYHFYLGYAQEKLGRGNQALNEYKKLITNAEDPPPPPAQPTPASFARVNPLPRYRRGMLYRKQRDFRKAKADLLEALNITARQCSIQCAETCGATPLDECPCVGQCIDKNELLAAREQLAFTLFERNELAGVSAELDTITKARAARGEELDAELLFIRGTANLELKSVKNISGALSDLEAARDKGFVDLKEADRRLPLRSLGLKEPAELHFIIAHIYKDSGRKADAIREFQTYMTKAEALNRSKAKEICNEIERMGGRIAACAEY